MKKLIRIQNHHKLFTFDEKYFLDSFRLVSAHYTFAQVIRSKQTDFMWSVHGAGKPLYLCIVSSLTLDVARALALALSSTVGGRCVNNTLSEPQILMPFSFSGCAQIDRFEPRMAHMHTRFWERSIRTQTQTKCFGCTKCACSEESRENRMKTARERLKRNRNEASGSLRDQSIATTITNAHKYFKCACIFIDAKLPVDGFIFFSFIFSFVIWHWSSDGDKRTAKTRKETKKKKNLTTMTTTTMPIASLFGSFVPSSFLFTVLFCCRSRRNKFVSACARERAKKLQQSMAQEWFANDVHSALLRLNAHEQTFVVSVWFCILRCNATWCTHFIFFISFQFNNGRTSVFISQITDWIYVIRFNAIFCRRSRYFSRFSFCYSFYLATTKQRRQQRQFVCSFSLHIVHITSMNVEFQAIGMLEFRSISLALI